MLRASDGSGAPGGPYSMDMQTEATVAKNTRAGTASRWLLAGLVAILNGGSGIDEIRRN